MNKIQLSLSNENRTFSKSLVTVKADNQLQATSDQVPCLVSAS